MNPCFFFFFCKSLWAWSACFCLCCFKFLMSFHYFNWFYSVSVSFWGYTLDKLPAQHPILVSSCCSFSFIVVPCRMCFMSRSRVMVWDLKHLAQMAWTQNRAGHNDVKCFIFQGISTIFVHFYGVASLKMVCVIFLNHKGCSFSLTLLCHSKKINIVKTKKNTKKGFKYHLHWPEGQICNIYRDVLADKFNEVYICRYLVI